MPSLERTRSFAHAETLDVELILSDAREVDGLTLAALTTTLFGDRHRTRGDATNKNSVFISTCRWKQHLMVVVVVVNFALGYYARNLLKM